MSLFHVHTTHYIHPVTKKRCPSKTPGAIKVRCRSRKWYGKVAGDKVPLHRNKATALQMLARLREDADAGQHGRSRKYRAIPLVRHMEDFERDIRAGRTGKRSSPPGEQHVGKVMAHLRNAIEGCTWSMPADLEMSTARRYLADLQQDGDLPDLGDREQFTLGEMRAYLGTAEDTVLRLITRHGLPHTGRHPRRLYPRSTLIALLRAQRKRRGYASNTVSEVAATLRRFSAWLAERCGWARSPLRDLPVSKQPQGDHRHERRSLTSRDLEKLLATTSAPGKKRRFRISSGADLLRIDWPGAGSYWLNGPQRKVVEMLLDAYLNCRSPEVAEVVLLRASGSNVRRLADLFVRSGAWGTLIVPGAGPATFRLAEAIGGDDQEEAVRVEPE